MKKEFDDRGANFIEVSESDGKVAIILSSKDGSSLNKTIINSVELTLEEFQELISDIHLTKNK